MPRSRRLDTTAEAAPSAREMEVDVPMHQAVNIGLIAAVLAALLIGGRLASEGELSWWAVPLRAVWRGLTIGAGIALGLYIADVLLGAVARHRQRGGRETRLEVEADGETTERERSVIPVRLDIQSGTQHRHLDVDVTAEMVAFCQRVLEWRRDEAAPLALSFSEASAKRVEFDGFLPLRDELMARGLLRWKNAEHHLSGYEFTRGFDEAVAFIAGMEVE